jgi:hypothetical protein
MADESLSDENVKKMFDTITQYYDEKGSAIMKWQRESLLVASALLTLLISFLPGQETSLCFRRLILASWTSLTLGGIISCARIYCEVCEKEKAFEKTKSHYVDCVKKGRIKHPLNKLVKTCKFADCLEIGSMVLLLMSMFCTLGCVYAKYLNW